MLCSVRTSSLPLLDRLCFELCVCCCESSSFPPGLTNLFEALTSIVEKNLRPSSVFAPVCFWASSFQLESSEIKAWFYWQKQACYFFFMSNSCRYSFKKLQVQFRSSPCQLSITVNTCYERSGRKAQCNLLKYQNNVPVQWSDVCMFGSSV